MKSFSKKSVGLVSSIALSLSFAACSADDNAKAKDPAVVSNDPSITHKDTAVETTTSATVSATNPSAFASDIALNRKISVTFSEVMLASTLNAESFTLTAADNTVIAGTVNHAPADAPLVFTFAPSVNLAAGTVYTAKISTAAKSLLGIALANEYSWSFTTGSTGDVLAPLAKENYPSASAANVPTNRQLTVTFDEAMDPTTITTESFKVSRPSGALLAGTVSYSGSTATFHPSAALEAQTIYTVTVTTDVKDLAGNALATSVVWTFTTGANAAMGPSPVALGTSGDYVILAKSAISTTGTTTIVGNLGLSPAAQSFMTGFSESLDASNVFASSILVTGKMFAADMAVPSPSNLTTAVSDMELAYTDAAGRKIPDFVELGAGDISGKTMVPGLYKWGTGLLMTSDITLAGSENDVWIFQIAQDVTVANGVHMTLSGGALPKNIFWQVAGKVTLGTTSSFNGVILSHTQIVLETGAVLNGRALAQTAVTLDSNAVTKPGL